MKLYKIKARSSKFAYFGRVDENLPTSEFIYRGTLRGKAWIPPKVYVSNPTRSGWDIAPFLGPSALVATRPAFDMFKDVFNDITTEKIPFTYEGKEFIVLNFISVLDCLDLKATVFRDAGDIESGPEIFVCRPDALTQPIFKLKRSEGGAPFVVEDSSRPSFDFFSRFNSLGLKGIEFEKVWDSEAK